MEQDSRELWRQVSAHLDEAARLGARAERRWRLAIWLNVAAVVLQLLWMLWKAFRG